MVVEPRPSSMEWRCAGQAPFPRGLPGEGGETSGVLIGETDSRTYLEIQAARIRGGSSPYPSPRIERVLVGGSEQDLGDASCG